MTSPHRLDSSVRAGRVDRTRRLRGTVDGVELSGHPGDTLASALLAEGRIVAAPSIHRGRPRGILAADCTEPNALVQLHGACPEPMLTATRVELYDGLVAESLSGVGRVGPEADTAVYDKKYVHADVVVIGAGPAGIAAALSAGRSGARVVLVDEQRELGGALLDGTERIDGHPATEWIGRAVRELVELPEVRVLTRASAVGCYEGNYLLVAEKRTDHLAEAGPQQPRQRLWHLRTQRVVLATGAHERPMVFADNDRPGIMLASAVRSYINRYAVLPGQQAVVFTTSDSAYTTALELLDAGARVPALVDTRPDPPAHLAEQVRAAGGQVYPGSAVVGTGGQERISSVRISELDEQGSLTGTPREVECDLLAVCGGWNPVVHLFSQAGGTVRWDPVVAGFLPEEPTGSLPKVVGAARGTYDLAGCLSQGLAAGAEAATTSGFRVAVPPVPPVAGDRPSTRPRPLWLVPAEEGTSEQWHTHFVDLQRDSTVADIWRALGAGMRSVEHVKRYTTISTGQDQGKTSGVNAVGVIADALMAGSPGEVGTTTHRPPYTPVPFALMAGRDRGGLHDPVRTTPMHSWHVAAGAVFEDVGQWKRARYYPRAGEDMDAAVQRECLAARTGVAMQDVSTLGRIEVVGPDAPEFLNRIYTNGFAKLPVGKARYGMMCTADGMVLDDGVSMRLAEDRYLMSTTTGGAAGVLDWLEEWLQTEWPHLGVHCTSVIEQWAAVAVVGPDSRAVVGRIAPELDVSAEAFGFMEFRDTVLRSGVPARICRVSFSGELAYEVNVPAWYGLAVWEEVAEAGADLGITPYGTETMHVLRAEKGFVIVGQDTDGTVTPLDLGMDWVVSRRKDFVGKRSFARPDTARTDRKQLVGLLPMDPQQQLPEGAHLVDPDGPRQPPVPMLGHVTSSYRSAALGRTFALALVADGRRRVGEVLCAPAGGTDIAVEVTKPIFYDEEGVRRDGRQYE
ncbi:sarcosine oxidase subunit alpha [Halopolyspora algeriensis]|uniref:Sarcosine oxidase subunit alpha n=1 Tax=Halopolyspora algeriensis TaxID=1500506 RepID=A0A368VNR8_9ACTN|nr:2Fe-2S iron-sulfur cluster-binding protein [Halopolyspora algeriensis]RCW43134.1 sarcosine oxidase subunit alpha [Halopolyspora algeriensis]TQM56192.1 sarcosine oxidase subunit alpha [Halopolyspora algeriensis]